MCRCSIASKRAQLYNSISRAWLRCLTEEVYAERMIYSERGYEECMLGRDRQTSYQMIYLDHLSSSLGTKALVNASPVLHIVDLLQLLDIIDLQHSLIRTIKLLPRTTSGVIVLRKQLETLVLGAWSSLVAQGYPHTVICPHLSSHSSFGHYMYSSATLDLLSI